MEELIEECRAYIENNIKLNPLVFTNFQNLQSFCQTINNEITDDCYATMYEAYKYIESINNGELCGQKTKEEIIEIVQSFLGAISSGLKERFIADLNNGLISLDKNHQNKCSYLTKTIDGLDKHYCKVYIKYTGTIIDAVILVHEFFHTLTDVVDYKDELTLDKNTLDYIQETVSILAEFVCIKYLENMYPIEMQSMILYRLYEEIYIDYQSASILMRYLNSVMAGMSVEELNKIFQVEELRKVIQKQKSVFAINHFVGTMVSITKLQDTKEHNELLKCVVQKIENKELEHIGEILPMRLNVFNIINFINASKNTKTGKPKNGE